MPWVLLMCDLGRRLQDESCVGKVKREEWGIQHFGEFGPNPVV